MTKGKNMDLETAANNLINLYIANRGSKDGEHISCITPKSLNEMTNKERRKCHVWKAWDDLREAIGELKISSYTNTKITRSKSFNMKIGRK